jgi:ParB family chromosome partitioning protein
MTTALDIPRGNRRRGATPEPTASAPAAAAPTVELLPLDQIDLGPNVRPDASADTEELVGLVESIEAHGVLQPIKVRRAGDRYQVIWGQRRLAASFLAKLETIPAIVVDDDRAAADVAAEQLTENLQRQDLNAIDEARALRSILDGDKSLTQQDLARRLGRSESWLSNRLRLLGLDDGIQDKIAKGELTESHGKAIASLPAKQQRELAAVVTREGTSTKDLERELEYKRQAAETEADRKKRTEKAIPRALAALEAAGVPKGAPVFVQAYGFEKIEPELKRAGHATTETYAHEVQEACKCKAWILELDGRKATVKPGCLSDHWRREHDRAANARHQAAARQEKETKRQLAEIQASLTASLEANPPAPIILALASYHIESGSWPRPQWSDYAQLDQAALVARFVARATDQHRLRELKLEELHAAATGQVIGQTSIEAPVDLVAAAAEIFGDDVAAITEEPATEQAAQVEQVAQVEQPVAEQAAAPAKAARKGRTK